MPGKTRKRVPKWVRNMRERQAERNAKKGVEKKPPVAAVVAIEEIDFDVIPEEDPAKPSIFGEFIEIEKIREVDPLYSDAVQAWIAKGKIPICSTEGFYQHQGECWNDSSLMMILYTDGLKEITQEALLTGDLKQLAYTLFTEKKYIIQPAVSKDLVKRMYWYLRVSRSRFIRQLINHYYRIELGARGNAENASMRAVAYNNRRVRGVGVNALASAALAAKPHNGLGVEDPYACSMVDYKYGYYSTFQLIRLLHMFNLYSVIKLNTYDANKYSLVNINYIASLGLLLSNKEEFTHAICLYSCNNIDYLFDNHYGVIQFPWRILFDTTAKGPFQIVNVQLIFKYRIGDIYRSYWPARYYATDSTIVVYDPLYSNSARRKPFYVLEWDGDMNKSVTWETPHYIIKFTEGSFTQVNELLHFDGRDVVAKDPALIAAGNAANKPLVVGRGINSLVYSNFDKARGEEAMAVAPIKPNADVPEGVDGGGRRRNTKKNRK